jgi:hypothetical protein
MSDQARQVEVIIEKLVHDVESSVHAMYRGSVRQATMRVQTDAIRNTAREGLLAMIGEARPTGNTAPAPVNASTLAPDEIAAITRCIMAWLPMGAPSTASPQSRCVPAAKELAPSWGEREKARLAVRRASA